jgi:hypothetical protein
VIEMLIRQGLLQQPVSTDDPTEVASWRGSANPGYWWHGLGSPR